MYSKIHLINFALLTTFLVIVSAVFATTRPLSAQAQAGAGLVKASIEITPKYPTPGQMVKAKLHSSSLDNDTALITWRLNGEIIQQSYSQREVTYKIGEVGSVSKITVVAEDASGFRVSAENTIHVGDVSVVWEGRTYTPPFYQGRALQTPGSEVAIVALPTILNAKGVAYTADELSYSWSTNHSTIPQISGKGKHSVTLINDKPFEVFTINLLVKDPQGVVRVGKKFVIPANQPSVVLYEDSPLIGIRYDKAITGTHNISDRETTIVSEPYYISASTRTDPALTYTWSIAGKTYTSPGSISLGSEGVGSGTALINLVIQNTAYWLQNGRADLTVDFGLNDTWRDINPDTDAL